MSTCKCQSDPPPFSSLFLPIFLTPERSGSLRRGPLPAFIEPKCQSIKCEITVERHSLRRNRHFHWYVEHALPSERIGINAQSIIMPRNYHLLFHFSEECFTDCSAYTQYAQKHEADDGIQQQVQYRVYFLLSVHRPDSTGTSNDRHSTQRMRWMRASKL